MSNWFNNLKIQKKLLTGFGFVIIILCFLSSFAVYRIYDLKKNYENLIDGISSRLNLATEASQNFTKEQLYVMFMAHQIDASKYKDQYNQYVKYDNDTKKFLENLIKSLQEDKSITINDKNVYLPKLQNILALLNNDYRSLVDDIYIKINNDVYEKDENILEDLYQTAVLIKGQIEEYITVVDQKSKIMYDSIDRSTQNQILIFLIVAIISIFVCIFFSIIIARNIKIPILQLSKAAREIVKGNFKVALGTNYKDEISLLSNDIASVVNTFKKMILEIEYTAGELEKGNIESRIDENKFNGEYKTAIVKINNTYSELLNDTMESVNCMKEYANGNFNAKIKRFVGKKAIIHEILDTVQINLKAINREISSIIKHALDGDFKYRINSEQYDGDWKKISEGLNDLLVHIEEPITEVAAVLGEVSKANFDTSIKGDYKGKFEEMKVAVNMTINNTSEYIQDIRYNLEQMAEQNLEISIKKEYIGEFKVIKSALEKIVKNFNRLIHEFNISAEQVSDGARQVSRFSLDLAHGAALQASAVEELNSTILAIADKTTNNALNTKQANVLSMETHGNGIEGKKEMDHMLTSMNEIEEASNNISKIIKVIDEIAFQTNLLALNAAVEAARAGTHGKGFAVVAEEVRSLAARSQQAALETTELINKTVGIVANGTKNAKSTAESLNEIVNKVTEIADLIDKVSTASTEQENAISQVKLGIIQISEVTQKNTATSEETASSAQELSSQSEVFKNALSMFKYKKSNF